MASAQVRVQHRKLSPVNMMNPGMVRLGRTGRTGSRNGRKVKKGLVAAWCKPGKLRVLLTHLPVGADTARVRYDICLISMQAISAQRANAAIGIV